MTQHDNMAASRRNLLKGAASMAVGAGVIATAASVNASSKSNSKIKVKAKTSSTITTDDGTQIYYKDWGTGPAVVFCHGYPLSSDAWENQMFFLVQHGFRVIAHDRRGFGRSSQPAQGYDYDTFADDLAALLDALDVRDAVLVGHSMGGGEVARYLARHGEDRVKKVALVAAVTPFLLKTADNPNGVPKEFFDTFRSAVVSDRSQWNRDVSMPYYNFNRPKAKVSEGVREEYWRQGQATGMMAAYHALGAFSETDFRTDLKKISVPTLVVHGSDDQIVPIEISGKIVMNYLKNATLKVYDGGSHGLIVTEKEKLNGDLLEFARA
ncbi:alpha/beta fold hydrolase [Rhizobium rhizogenes]|uniref:alpha/beta fold hydrolase n=1 Tax=Rhizobium rhizogenes TaxID=359 RepID=UPI001573F42B|nr:alpha/beta hydrolase [Rhizobium rhizogenes]NTF98258.1 alpha/beta hydrolase [Rhizobium rhizogenes]